LSTPGNLEIGDGRPHTTIVDLFHGKDETLGARNQLLRVFCCDRLFLAVHRTALSTSGLERRGDWHPGHGAADLGGAAGPADRGLRRSAFKPPAGVSAAADSDGTGGVSAVFRAGIRASSLMVKLTKLEKSIIEAIKNARLGLPDWPAFAKQESLALDYVQQRIEWMRRMGLIK
jgi:hypothetical protein